MNHMRYILTVIVLSACVVQGTSQDTDFVVTIKTKFGDMVAILYDETPKHKANFIRLAREHYFDSLLFHRVIRGFMIQGGDPQSRKSPKGQRLGNGGPGYTVDAEINPSFFHHRGALSAARLGDDLNPSKASSGSQFYIVQGRAYRKEELLTDPQKFSAAIQQFLRNPANKRHADSLNVLYRRNDRVAYEALLVSLKPEIEKQLGIKVDKEMPAAALEAYTTIGGAPHLDGDYTVFGRVIRGLEVIDSIASQPTDRTHRPVDDIRMVITVEELPRKKIEKLYNFKYPDNK